MLSCALPQNRLAGRRVTGAVLLFFVFFLPLHFHPANENPQITHECSCYLEGRAQLGPAPSPPILVFAPDNFIIVVIRADSLVVSMIESDSARAPPLSLS